MGVEEGDRWIGIYIVGRMTAMEAVGDTVNQRSSFKTQQSTVFNRNPAMVAYMRPFSIEGSCNHI